jgi:glycosyltransferase involved in cell wall biosynthesis
VLGNGIDLTRFEPDAAKRSRVRLDLGLDDDDIVIGAVGRLVREKGYPELLEANRAVKEQVSSASLVVVGPHEPDKADALSVSEIAAAEDAGVRFLGHRDDVEDLYPAMDIYVLASHREGFPRSAMEAAATGLPLILTNIRGCRQVVNDGVNGLLVPPDNATALATAITELAQSRDLRARMGAAGITKAALDFNQQRVIETTLATYRRLLD